MRAMASRARLVLGRDGRLALVNPAAERLLGYAQAELLGSRSAHLVPERQRKAFERERRRYFAEPWASRRTFQISLVDRQGRERLLRGSPEPLPGPEGLWVSVWLDPVEEA
jgi:PAS domain S-box-containing protein